jgi:hypothetical protein
MSATTAAAAAYELGLTTAATTAVLTMRPRNGRGCDRQRGNARCEKHPGHDFVSFRTVKTARSSHRSNH